MRFLLVLLIALLLPVSALCTFGLVLVREDNALIYDTGTLPFATAAAVPGHPARAVFVPGEPVTFRVEIRSNYRGEGRIVRYLQRVSREADGRMSVENVTRASDVVTLNPAAGALYPLAVELPRWLPPGTYRIKQEIVFSPYFLPHFSSGVTAVFKVEPGAPPRRGQDDGADDAPRVSPSSAPLEL